MAKRIVVDGVEVVFERRTEREVALETIGFLAQPGRDGRGPGRGERVAPGAGRG